MSSLAASKADNFYHPPDWDPTKASRKKFQGSKGHNQYEQYGVIRFELPYDGWCLGCGRHYGKGTRFNAKKEQDGFYFRTKIWRFTMRCHSCPQTIVVLTDPKNTDYAFREGLKKKEEEFEVTAQSGADSVEARVQEKLDQIYHVGGHSAEEERHARATNAIYKLEHAQDDKRRVATEAEKIQTLFDLGQTRRLYDYDANAALRRTMRKRRRAEEALTKEAEERGFSIKLLPADESDARAAAQALHRRSSGVSAANQAKFRTAERRSLAKVKGGSIFGASSVMNDVAIGGMLVPRAFFHCVAPSSPASIWFQRGARSADIIAANPSLWRTGRAPLVEEDAETVQSGPLRANETALAAVRPKLRRKGAMKTSEKTGKRRITGADKPDAEAASGSSKVDHKKNGRRHIYPSPGALGQAQSGSGLSVHHDAAGDVLGAVETMVDGNKGSQMKKNVAQRPQKEEKDADQQRGTVDDHDGTSDQEGENALFALGSLY